MPVRVDDLSRRIRSVPGVGADPDDVSLRARGRRSWFDLGVSLAHMNAITAADAAVASVAAVAY